jgi:type II secretory pathway component PulC
MLSFPRLGPPGAHAFIVPGLFIVAFLNAVAISGLLRAAWSCPEVDSGLRTSTSARPVPPTSERSANVILARNPFEHHSPRVEDVGAPFPPQCVGIRATIIVAEGDPQGGLIALEDHGQRLLRGIGGNVGGAKVIAIEREHIWLESAEGTCTVALFAEHADVPPKPPFASPAATGEGTWFQRYVVKLGAGSYAVERQAVERLLSDPTELMRHRLVPVLEAGTAVGMQIFGIKPSGVLAQLGVENGDTLETLNGYPLADPQQALAAFARLRTADKLVLQVRRAGAPKTLDYEVR